MEYKCKICAGKITIDYKNNIAVCDYCGAKQTFEELNGVEVDHKKIVSKLNKKWPISVIIAAGILSIILIGGMVAFLTLRHIDIVKNVEQSEEQSIESIDDKNIQEEQEEQKEKTVERFMNRKITAEFLRQILAKKTTIGDLKRQGYELTFESSIGSEIEGDCTYCFEKTGIYVSTYQEGEYENNKNNDDSAIVNVIYAPIVLIDPERIGDMDIPYIEGEYVYYPNGSYIPEDGRIICQHYERLERITDDTTVVFKMMTADDKLLYYDDINRKGNKNIDTILSDGKYGANFISDEQINIQLDTYVKNISFENDMFNLEGNICYEETMEIVVGAQVTVPIADDARYLIWDWEAENWETEVTRIEFEKIYKNSNSGVEEIHFKLTGGIATEFELSGIGLQQVNEDCTELDCVFARLKGEHGGDTGNYIGIAHIGDEYFDPADFPKGAKWVFETRGGYQYTDLDVCQYTEDSITFHLPEECREISGDWYEKIAENSQGGIDWYCGPSIESMNLEISTDD